MQNPALDVLRLEPLAKDIASGGMYCGYDRYLSRIKGDYSKAAAEIAAELDLIAADYGRVWSVRGCIEDGCASLYAKTAYGEAIIMREYFPES